MGIPALSQYTQEAVPLTQRSLAAASIGASYSLVGSIFGRGVTVLIIVSTLDEDVQLSLDGTNDWIPLVAGSTIVVDQKTNGIVLGGWRGVYVKEIGNPTTGSIYVGGFSI